MALRSFPADTKLQKFYSEQYQKEANARLKFFYENRRGGGPSDSGRSASACVATLDKRATVNGLPAIHPAEFAKKLKLEAEAGKARLAELAARRYDDVKEMRPPSLREKSCLFDGFSKEGKGRYQYLKERKLIIPEQRYVFPITSSWDYGWKIREAVQFQRPTYPRTRMIADSFYTRNGIPTMYNPNMAIRERAQTTL